MGLRRTGFEVEEDVIHMLFVRHGFENLDGGFGEYEIIGR